MPDFVNGIVGQGTQAFSTIEEVEMHCPFDTFIGGNISCRGGEAQNSALHGTTAGGGNDRQSLGLIRNRGHQIQIGLAQGANLLLYLVKAQSGRFQLGF